MKKEFSFYEFVGIIAPGMIFLVLVTQSLPEIQKIIKIQDLSLGGFGLSVIIAYVVGHLIQSLGNLIENIWWYFWGGMPTNWVIKRGKCTYLSEEQFSVLLSQVGSVLGLSPKDSLQNYEAKEWFAITRQIYAATKQANATDRVDIFNGNYGFFRGIVSALVFGITLIIIQSGLTKLTLLFILFCFLLMAFARMHRFAIHYARELFVQFIQIKSVPGD